MSEAIIDKLSKLENIIAEYDDIVKNEAEDFIKDYGIISSETMKTALSELEKENRLLNIGIIGRVKAGKSSILNSIFFNGEPVLPKAATPMTASLTVLTYGDAFSASVEYFSPQDIENIKKEHSTYKAEWDKLHEKHKKEVEERAKKRNETPDSDKARRLTDADMKEKHRYYASYDQYERMQKTGANPPKEITQPLAASSLSELLGKLNEFVGSEGKMMPYAKSVEIKIPEDSLQDICVVDTPGINDPVKSREARTEEYLKKCDVVFIISPAGQFLSKEDTDLMDRVSGNEGIRELYLVASQADNQLYGSVGNETKFNLPEAAKKIKSDLSSQAVSIISNLKNNNPEVAGQFDQLISGGKERIIITSAICNDMLVKYDNRSSWDNNMNHVWGLLNEKYRDYFNSDASAKTNLELLSGIEKAKEKIGIAKKDKDKIIAQKQADYLSSQAKNTDGFLQELINAVREKSDRIKNSDITGIENQKKQTKTLISKGTEAIDGTYEDCVDEFKIKIRNLVSKECKILFDNIKDKTDADGLKITKTRHWTTGWWIFKTHHSENYDTLRTGIIKSALNSLVSDLQDILVNTIEEAKMEWKKTVQTNVTRSLREALEDDSLIDVSMLKTAIRRLVNNIELPEIDFGSNTFASSYSGVIEDYEIDLFMDEVEAFKSNLRRIFNKTRDEFLASIERTAKKEKMSGMIFTDLLKQLDLLEKEVRNKELTLDRLKKCADALSRL